MELNKNDAQNFLYIQICFKSNPFGSFRSNEHKHNRGFNGIFYDAFYDVKY
jgi:hypothetical protein